VRRKGEFLAAGSMTPPDAVGAAPLLPATSWSIKELDACFVVRDASGQFLL
jgi:hypothetical protein